MKQFKKLFFSLLICCSVVLLCACNNGAKNKAITKVEAENFKQFYYVEETIDLSEISLKITRANKKTETLTKSEIDLPEGQKPKATTEFVLKTSGLSAALAGLEEGDNLPAGKYAIKALVIENNQEYDLGKITIAADASDIYNINEFGVPENFAKFKTNSVQDESGLSEEAKFKTHEQSVIYVGDENPIEIKPQFTLALKSNPLSIANQNTFDLVLNVVVKKGDEVQNETIYTFENGLLDFTDAAIGDDTYTVIVTARDFPTKSFELQMKVQHGFNIQHAYELGILTMIDSDRTTTDWYSGYDQSLPVFYNGEKDNKQHIPRDYYDIWKPFLKEKGMDEKYIKEVDSIFILADLSVTKDDVPADYFVTADEAGEGAYAVGGLRDWSYLYQHFLTKDFTFNGNYFAIDFKSFPLVTTEQSYTTDNPGPAPRILTSGTDKPFAGHAAAFAFIGPNNNNQYDCTEKVTIINLNMLGNADTTKFRTDDKGDLKTDALVLGESLINLRAMACPVNMDNMIMKNFFISYFPESYNNTEHEAELRNVKMYDTFSNAIYNWGAITGGKLIDSEIKRCGGPAILLVTNGKDENGVHTGSNLLGQTSITISANTVVESYLNGSEPWFTLVGATSLVPYIGAIDDVLSKALPMKTVYNINVEGKEGRNLFNCICATIDCDYVTTSNATSRAKFTQVGDEIPFIADTTDQMFQAMQSFNMDVEVPTEPDNPESPKQTVNTYAGKYATNATHALPTKLYIMKAFGATEQTPHIGLVFTLYDNATPAA